MNRIIFCLTLVLIVFSSCTSIAQPTSNQSQKLLEKKKHEQQNALLKHYNLAALYGMKGKVKTVVAEQTIYGDNSKILYSSVTTDTFSPEGHVLGEAVHSNMSDQNTIEYYYYDNNWHDTLKLMYDVGGTVVSETRNYYDNNGNLSHSTDINTGRDTKEWLATFKYDAQQNLISMVMASGESADNRIVKVMTYNSDGLLKAELDTMPAFSYIGSKIRTYDDKYNDVVDTVLMPGQPHGYYINSFDSAGRVTSNLFYDMNHERLGRGTIKYDAHGNVIETDFAYTKQISKNGKHTIYKLSYDKTGNIVESKTYNVVDKKQQLEELKTIKYTYY